MGIEFYIFYKFVICEEVISIKLWVVYDVLVRVYVCVLFLNECLYLGFLL